MSIIQIADVRTSWIFVVIRCTVISPRFVKIYEAWNIVYTRDGMPVSSNSRVNCELRAHEETPRISWANLCRGCIQMSLSRLNNWMLCASKKFLHSAKVFLQKKSFNRKCKGNEEHFYMGARCCFRKLRFIGIDFRETTPSYSATRDNSRDVNHYFICNLPLIKYRRSIFSSGFSLPYYPYTFREFEICRCIWAALSHLVCAFMCSNIHARSAKPSKWVGRTTSNNFVSATIPL